MKRKALVSLLLMLVAISICGCQAPVPSGDADGVRQSVRAYNDALVDAFANFDMNTLSRSSTEEQAQREYYLMAALGEGRVQMLSTLVSIEFGEVAFPTEDTASVTTTETWDYDHVSLDTSETVRTERGVVYHLQYDLVLQDGRWLVDAVASLDDAPESEEATP